jgi:tetratricopeptide (TPR) repeat protein
MSDEVVDLCQTISGWVASTDGLEVPVPKSTDVRQHVEAVRGLIRGRKAEAGDLNPDDETLAALSLLSSELIAGSEPSVSVLEDAEGAFDAVSVLAWSHDQFGEIPELLCRFAFIAWRHARALGDAPLSQQWLERFEKNVLRGSVSQECISYFLEAPALDRSSNLNASFLIDPETLFSICTILKEKRNATPAAVANQLPSLREWVDARFWPKNFSDEREYFLGQIEFSIAVCSRWLGDRESVALWLDRAEQRYARTVEPETGRAEVELLRLVTRYETGHYDSVFASIPSLQSRLRSLGMATPLVKSEILRAAVLKNLGRVGDSIVPLQTALESDAIAGNVSVKAFALESLGDTYSLLGRFKEAADCFQAAFALLGQRESPTAQAFLKLAVGEMFRIQGQMDRALKAFREALQDYAALGAEAWVAYARLLVGEVLLALSREREAEAEIVAALPIIEERKLVREGLAAVTILRESIRRRKTDRNALRELREHLQGRR